MQKGRSGISGMVFMCSGGICKTQRGANCHVIYYSLNFDLLTRQRTETMARHQVFTSIGAIGIENATNKAVTEMGVTLHAIYKQRA